MTASLPSENTVSIHAVSTNQGKPLHGSEEENDVYGEFLDLQCNTTQNEAVF